MKKVKLLLLSLVLVTVLTGCGSNKELSCSMTDTTSGLEVKSSVNIKLKNSKVDDMSVVVDAKIPEELAEQKQTIIDTLKGTDNSFEVSETEDGVRLTAGKDSKYFSNFNLEKEKVSYDELKETFEAAGFKCE